MEIANAEPYLGNQKEEDELTFDIHKKAYCKEIIQIINNID